MRNFLVVRTTTILGREYLRLYYILVLLFFLILSSATLQAQNYHKDRSKFYKQTYKHSTSKLVRACDELKRKRNRTKNNKVHSSSSFASNRRKSKSSPPMAEVSVAPTAKNTSKAAPVAAVKKAPVLTPKTIPSPNQPAFTPSPIASKQALEKLHNKEDDVLRLNHLPAPSSAKHEEIRRLVSNTLKNKKDTEPIELEPLYFTFDEDEFSVVDMDPFLIAVEFALQGKHILIEGHTDSKGQDDYNVKLSIKRVEKIRQLMKDMGVSDDLISVVGYGEEVNDHADKSEQGRQKNRRVDFKAF